MTKFANGITIRPENVRLLLVLPDDELTEVVRAVLLYATGAEPDEATFSSDKIRLAYEVVRNQIDATARQRRGSVRYIPEQAGGDFNGTSGGNRS